MGHILHVLVHSVYIRFGRERTWRRSSCCGFVDVYFRDAGPNLLFIAVMIHYRYTTVETVRYDTHAQSRRYAPPCCFLCFQKKYARPDGWSLRGRGLVPLNFVVVCAYAFLFPGSDERRTPSTWAVFRFTACIESIFCVLTGGLLAGHSCFLLC